LNAVAAADPDRALAEADALDDARAAGQPLGPLAGVPVIVKDNLWDEGVECSAASESHVGFIAPDTATTVRRLRAAGAVVLARGNMDELGMGSRTAWSRFGPARHPLDARRSPGGSSGGCAALVAAGVAPLALGSDTGGSVRQPAAWCGVYGLRPTRGVLSRWGLVPLASSMDTVGLLSATLGDLACALDAMLGPDPLDQTTLPRPPWRLDTALGAPPQGLRVGLLTTPGAEADPEIGAQVERAAAALGEQGARITPVTLHGLPEARLAYAALCAAEAASNLARFDGQRFGPPSPGDDADAQALSARSRFGEEVRRRVLLGHALGDDRRRRASAVRGRVTEAIVSLLDHHDLLLCPATPTVAARLEDEDAAANADLFLIPASLAGRPSLSVPYGVVDGLPVGVQLIGRAGGEEALFTAAAALCA
ncbi:Asp-tRNA(Asn)/Glu-tRNA(Gln) amidotransferase subunit GatA, partial [Myxococcota bacterium]|nr:Asp-tRNA(Asn)/Glu-tRNA(Gln) amidotransferase subunit GatA [Myxococcota bacterium]